MKSMYANRISIALNGTEAFLKFDCLAPEYGDDNSPKGQEIRDSQEIVVGINALPKIRDMINDLLAAAEEK